jgi:putative tryptophan/tyrosine transport system substrate-binding protein
MRRRDFIGAMHLAAVALASAAAAQQSGKVWRIGDVNPGTPETSAIFVRALEQSLADLGYVQGRNILLLHRFAGPQPEKIEQAITSLLPQIDLLVVGGEGAIAAKKLAGGVPTVFVSIGFPVELGLVQSLAHPGGNMTGITSEAALETSAKRLQILKEILPELKRVAVLRPVDDPAFVEKPLQDLAARDLEVTLVPVGIKSADDLEAAFASIKKDGAQAVMPTRSSLTFGLGKEIADLALADHLPSCYPFRQAVMAGGLVSLGPDRVAMTRPAAAQIDKIIKGTSPGDIPVEQPSRFELYINLKTARLLNLTIPPSLLARADEVIE